MTDAPWPVELKVSGGRDRLAVAFDDGTLAELSAEYLRVHTPSAERTGHGARQVIGGKRGVCIVALTPVGRYAVRIGFDDGHDSGIYPLTTLKPLADAHEANWARYVAELEATGLDRERPGTAPAPT